MNPDYVILAVGLGILGFLWSLHRDMRALSERVSRLEGILEGLRALPDRVSRLEGLLEGLRDAITGRHRESAD